MCWATPTSATRRTPRATSRPAPLATGTLAIGAPCLHGCRGRAQSTACQPASAGALAWCACRQSLPAVQQCVRCATRHGEVHACFNSRHRIVCRSDQATQAVSQLAAGHAAVACMPAADPDLLCGSGPSKVCTLSSWGNPTSGQRMAVEPSVAPSGRTRSRQWCGRRI